MKSPGASRRFHVRAPPVLLPPGTVPEDAEIAIQFTRLGCRHRTEWAAFDEATALAPPQPPRVALRVLAGRVLLSWTAAPAEEYVVRVEASNGQSAAVRVGAKGNWLGEGADLAEHFRDWVRFQVLASGPGGRRESPWTAAVEVVDGRVRLLSESTALTRYMRERHAHTKNIERAESRHLLKQQTSRQMFLPQ